MTLAKVAASATLAPPTPERLARAEKGVAESRALTSANLKRVADAGIPIAMGTDAGNPLTLHGPSVYAEMEAMQAAGLTPMQVLSASTHGGSLAMGLEDVTGTIEKGKSADLLVVVRGPDEGHRQPAQDPLRDAGGSASPDRGASGFEYYGSLTDLA